MISRGGLVVLIVMLFSVNGIAQILGFSLPPGKSKVNFPIEIHNNLVVVPLVLNGQLPLKFILDTGVRTTILTEKAYSDILNLTYSRKYSIAGPGGVNVVDAYVTNNVSLDMPGVSGRGHAMLVLEKDYLELRNNLGSDVHGILGYELFSRFVIKIDYERKELTLMMPERFKHSKRYQVLPITIEDTKPYLNAIVKMNDTTSVNAKLMVDSGASHGIFLESNSDKRLEAPDKNIESIIGRGLGGEIRGHIARIKALKLADYTIVNPLANFPDAATYIDTLKVSQDVFRNGSIGGEVLSRFTVVFNFPEEQIYFKKNSSLKKQFYYSLSGLTIRAKGARLKNFEISDVRKNSAGAKAGLRSGDEITSINGVSALDLDLNTINGLLNYKPGKKVQLIIERKGIRERVELKLEDSI